MGSDNSSSGGGGVVSLILALVIVSYWRYGEVAVLLTAEPWLSPMFYVYVFFTSILVSLALALISVLVVLVTGGTILGAGLLGYGAYKFIVQSGASIKSFIKQKTK